VQIVVRAMGMSAALALGACAMPDMESFKTPDASIFQSRSVSVLRESSQRPVTGEDLVDAEGRCGVNVEPAPQAGGNLPPGVALEMTECEVVSRVGQPEKVDFGTNERGERTAILTYIRGTRPGIYSFSAGRLTAIERGPEPPAPPKPVRPAKPRPKKTTT
jgi:hypothetical protein